MPQNTLCAFTLVLPGVFALASAIVLTAMLTPGAGEGVLVAGAVVVLGAVSVVPGLVMVVGAARMGVPRGGVTHGIVLFASIHAALCLLASPVLVLVTAFMAQEMGPRGYTWDLLDSPLHSLAWWIASACLFLLPVNAWALGARSRHIVNEAMGFGGSGAPRGRRVGGHVPGYHFDGERYHKLQGHAEAQPPGGDV